MQSSLRWPQPRKSKRVSLGSLEIARQSLVEPGISSTWVATKLFSLLHFREGLRELPGTVVGYRRAQMGRRGTWVFAGVATGRNERQVPRLSSPRKRGSERRSG